VFGSRKGKDQDAAAAKPAPKAPAAAKAGSPPKDASGSPDGPSKEAQMRAAVAIRQSLAFTQIVSVLMRSPHYKHYTLADLEWLVLPPLVTGQFSVAEASVGPNGPKVPAAIALWASVSAEVDKRLSGDLNAPMRLRPDEWRSGDTLWLIDAVGDPRIVPELLKRLRESVFKQKDLKVRGRGQDGKPVVQVLRAGSAG